MTMNQLIVISYHFTVCCIMEKTKTTRPGARCGWAIAIPNAVQYHGTYIPK